MRKDQLENILDSITPKLYGFCQALTRNQDEAEQMFIDAYTVFILKEKHFVAEMQVNLESKKERVSTKRYFLNEILKEIYELGRMRTPRNRFDNSAFMEYENFYDLNIQKRAVLYLKDAAGMSVEDIQEVFVMQRHQVIEILHNAYYGLTSDIKDFKSEVQESV